MFPDSVSYDYAHTEVKFYPEVESQTGLSSAPTTSDYKLNPQLGYFGSKTRLKFKESCLKHDKITYDNGKIVNI